MVTSRDYFRNRLGGGVVMEKKVLIISSKTFTKYVNKYWSEVIAEIREKRPYQIEMKIGNQNKEQL